MSIDQPQQPEGFDEDAPTDPQIPNDPATLEAAREAVKQEARHPTNSVEPNPYTQPVRPTPAQALPSEEREPMPLDDPNHPAHQRVHIPVRPAPWLTWKNVEHLMYGTTIAILSVLAVIAGDKLVRRMYGPGQVQRPIQPLSAKEVPWRAVFTEAEAVEALRASGLTGEPGKTGLETADPRQLTQLNAAFPFQYPEHIQSRTDDHQLRIARVHLENGRVSVRLTDIAMGPGRGQHEPRTERTYTFDQEGNPIHRQKGDLSIAQQEALWSFIAPKN